MPDFDGGHYFYTGLMPIRRPSVPRADGTMTAPSHIVREVLATLPNFSQIKDVRRTSPFARCTRTHFVRMAVIDDPAFNGRDPADAIKQALTGVNLLEHQPVDHLSRPWLLFEADFDSPDGSAGSRDAWAAEQWDLMDAELTAIFAHCHGFETVKDGAGFASFLARAQIPTTMSFNDYYIDPLNLPTLSMTRLLVQLALPIVLLLLLVWYLDREAAVGWPVYVGAGLLGLVIGLWATYRLVMSRGGRPFPPAPNGEGTLDTVLKGLYLQQKFSQFATDHQGDPPDQLYAAFGTFLADHDPANDRKPTQPPGVLNS